MSLALFLATFVYVSGVLLCLGAGIALYADARHFDPNDSRSDKTSPLRLIRGCLIWPLLALSALMPTLADITQDLRRKP